MTYRKTRGRPDAIIRTCKSEIQMFVQYEDDPEKLKQFDEDFKRVLQYVAKQGGWLNVLDEIDAAAERIIQISEELDKMKSSKVQKLVECASDGTTT